MLVRDIKKSKNPILFQFQLVQHKLMSMCITLKWPSFSKLLQKYKYVIEIPIFSLFYTETVIYIPYYKSWSQKGKPQIPGNRRSRKDSQPSFIGILQDKDKHSFSKTSILEERKKPKACKVAYLFRSHFGSCLPILAGSGDSKISSTQLSVRHKLFPEAILVAVIDLLVLRDKYKSCQLTVIFQICRKIVKILKSIKTLDFVGYNHK